MREWIVGMTMTLYTAECCTKHCFPHGVYPVDDRSVPEFFIIRSSFVVGHRITLESCCYVIVVGCTGHHITSNLLREKLVVWFVVVEGPDQPIAVFPYRSRFILFISFCVCIPRKVEPHG